MKVWWNATFARAFLPEVTDDDTADIVLPIEQTPHARSAANLVYYRWLIRFPSTKMGIGIRPGTMFFIKKGRNSRGKKSHFGINKGLLEWGTGLPRDPSCMVAVARQHRLRRSSAQSESRAGTYGRRS